MLGGVTRHMLSHLPGVPHLHVNRPYKVAIIRRRRLIEGRLLFEEMGYSLLTITASCLLNMLSVIKKKEK